MRYKATVNLLVIILSFYKPVFSQTALLHNYETSIDAKTRSKVLKGLLTRADIENDTSGIFISKEWFKISDGNFCGYLV